MVVHIFPTGIGTFIEARTKLRGNDMEPIVSALINEHIVPLLVTDSGLRNLAEKLRLEVFKARWIFARFRAVSINCVTNELATSLCLDDSRG